VRISDARLARPKYQELVAGCEIGLAFYDPDFSGRRDMNVYVMGLASGKVADYLQKGLPVIASRLPGLEDLLRDWRCGVCVDSLDEVAGAIRVIDADLGAMSHGARACFDQVLELARNVEPLLEALSA
jgi:hypothetical protein